MGVDVAKRSFPSVKASGRKAVRYLASGAVVYGINIGLVYVFSEVFRWWYLISSAVAFVVSVVVSFLVQKFWTFRDRDMSVWRAQLTSTFGLSMANLILNVVSMYGMVSYMHVNYLVSQVLVSALIAAVSFIVYQYVIFRPRRKASRNPRALSEGEGP